MASRLSPAVVADAIEGWADAEGPLYRRLAGAMERAILSGRLPSDAVLPPERHLASRLAVSRSTVVAAFEALKDRGRLEARQGSGTWVRGPRRLAEEGNAELVEALEGHAIIRDLSGAPTEPLELTAAAVDCAPEVLRASAEVDPGQLALVSSGHGYSPQGIEPLRVAVAERLSATGLPTTPQQVLITSGATQAVHLATRLFLEPGAVAVVETPSYAGAIDVLSAAGARLAPVDVDRAGGRTDHLAEHLARSSPRLVYLVPDFHNPTGMVMSAARRAEVARLASSYHVPVIEDLVQRDLWFDVEPPAPIASLDPDAPLLTIGSMSKVFWGGLRLGWVRAGERTIARLARMKAVTDFGTPVLPQLVAAALLPSVDDVAARRRHELSARLDHLEAALRAHVPDWTWQRPAGGLSIWARLPAPRAGELARHALAYGVAVVPGTTFATGDQRHLDRLRLPFVAPPHVLDEAVARLAAAWGDIAGARPRQTPAALVV